MWKRTAIIGRTLSLLLIASWTLLSWAADEAANSTAKAGKKPQPGNSDYREIGWDALMPPLDQDFLDDYNKGELDMEQIDSYLSKHGKISVPDLDKMKVRIPGYLVPLNANAKQRATELLLVPTQGACIHTPPPPPNQTVYLKYKPGVEVTEAAYMPFWLEGTLRVEKRKSTFTDTLYTIEVTSIKEYQ